MRQKSSVEVLKFSLVYSKLRHCINLKLLTLKLLLKTRKSRVNHQTAQKYLIAICDTYQASSKIKKTNLLDHAQLITKRSRKQLIRQLKSLSEHPKELATTRTGRPRVYSQDELRPHIHYLWYKMEQVSAKRMKEGLSLWLPKYRQLDPHLKVQLERMSASTLGRYIREIQRQDEPRKGLATTNPARYMKNKVPINTLDSKITKPGYIQTDTVAHCGNNGMGPFISSLTVTDVYSTWTVNRAMYTKRGIEVKQMFRDIEQNLPFKLLSINTDSGSEFLNKNMLQFTNYGSRIGFTRSRPYKKNDNCYVEQKNYTHVRELFGYERFDDRQLVDLMNEIYKNYWNPLQNYFLPTFKIKEKVRIGSKIKKKYDKPKTPCQRLLNSKDLSEEQKEYLRKEQYQLDPFELKENLEKKLQEFFELVRQKNIRKAS